MLKYILAASGLCLMLACQPVQPSGHSHGEESHSHDEEGDHSHADAGTVSYTKWAGQVELFVEFKPLVVGEVSRFAAHFTRISDYKPVREGSVAVSLIVGEKGSRQSVERPSSPGIFTPALQPTSSGVGQLIFELKTPGFSERIVLEDIQVFANAGDAIAAMPEESASGDAIDFLKEQAWKIDFAIEQVQRQPIQEVIHTSGEIQPVKGEEKIIAAKSSGIVFFKNSKLQEGREVRAGELLFTINSQGLVQANLEEKYQVAQARLEKAKANFERAEDLLTKQIIGKKEYEQRKMEYSVAEAEFQTLTGSYSAGGQSITSSMSGIIKDIMVSDGQFVEEGAPLIKVTNNRRLLLQAEVSQKYLPQLGQVRSANFKTPYQEEVQALADYNGRLVTYGKVLEPGTSFIPVLFELDNLRELIPGSFVELYLLANPIENTLVVPKSALMQDYNLQYVYVEAAGESFEKRPVKLGVSDGFKVQVLSGLSEGEWVVTEGAYQIKMASMSSTIPAHGHTH
ncbi:MAG: efflux RND transporter periplasmic adaptor subunit [Lewinellaceae bacterium]|nr:efflux RND transporter periplasmic adaptor subunit [Lewinellaceae bacterium]